MSQREPSDAEVDQAFAEIVGRLRRNEAMLGDAWADSHPLFRRDVPEHESADPHQGPDPEPAAPSPAPPTDPAPRVSAWRGYELAEESDEEPDDDLPVTDLPPWRPSTVATAGLALVAGAVLLTVLLIAQVRLPWWVGWATLAGFLTGMGLLFSRLPRDREDDGDDGARV